MPKWYDLLAQWRDDGNFGLGIPFVFGALSECPDRPLGTGNGKEQMQALLTSIRDEAPEGAHIRLYSCDRLQDIALAIVGGVPAFCSSLPSTVRAGCFFYVEQAVLPANEATVEALTELLWSRYASDIAGGRFSHQGGVLRPFNDDERVFATRAFSRVAADV